MFSAHRQLMRNLTLALLLLLLQPLPAFFRPAVAAEECDGRQPLVEWQTLTKRNYSSEIRLHPHLLLLVTVPWSGESRSLMKQLGHAVNSEQCRFGSLKLRVLFRNSEKMLAEALGANTGISVLYFHNSLFYKYRGRLRAHSILSSVNYVMSLLPEELPLKSLNTPEELKAFLGSTDKALLLLEFCGWTHKVLASGKNNGTENGFGLNEELNETISTNESTAQKGMENEKMDCDIDDGVGFIPQLNKFSLGNESALTNAGNTTHGGSSCEINEFVHFKSFLEKSLTVTREFFLPPERLKFGLVPNRSLLSVLNIEDPGPWLMTLQVAGCPTCSNVLKEDDDLKTIIQTQASLVAELENDADDPGLTLPANTPSMLLFVDRSSDSSTLRQESKQAMDAFRELALHYHNSHMGSGKDTLISEKRSAEAIQKLKGASKHRRLDLFQAAQKINVNEKMSIVIMNEGKHVSVENLVADLQGSSLHEILTYALKKKKGMKLSTIAKDAGFQLLSEDLNIELGDTLAVQEGDHSDQVSGSPTDNVSKDTLDSESSHNDPSNVNTEYAQPLAAQAEVQSDQPSEGDPVVVQEANLDLNKIQMPEKADIFYGEHVAQSELSAAESFQQNNNENFIEHSHVQDATDNSENERIFEKTLEVDEQNQERSFGGSFFFCDGQYRLLRALTGGSKIPSAVIVDPILQRHYVLAEEAVFSHSLLAEFLDRFINESLPPYQQSEPFAPNPRVAPNPPFVNQDFHEADSIPRITANSFTELVLGNLSDPMYASNSWSQDVLVLFSNSWCGFCQRMELVVREVYRAIHGYANMLKTAFDDNKMSLTEDGLTNALVKLPLVYLMDCTLNDCSLILKPLVQREVYPLLLLFPAESKNAVLYKGDVAVYEIIKFLKEHGNDSSGLVREKDSLRTGAGEEELDQNLQKDAPLLKNLYHEVLLKDRMPNSGAKHRQIVSSLNGHQTPLQVVVGSMLIATDMLLNSHPFGESIILIVNGNQSLGFQGLIVNKQIKWESMDEIEEGLEFLKATPLSFGGPVLRRGMPLVALSKRIIEDHNPEVLPNIYFLDQEATLRLLDEAKAGNKSVHDVWFFVGFSRWDGDQLVNEIIEGAWTLSKGTEEQLGWPVM
nr:Protein disulfide-isomerase [Ipomoea batatas]